MRNNEVLSEQTHHLFKEIKETKTWSKYFKSNQQVQKQTQTYKILVPMETNPFKNGEV